VLQNSKKNKIEILAKWQQFGEKSFREFKWHSLICTIYFWFIFAD